MTLQLFVQLLAAGVLLGGVYALISIGLTLIFGVMRVVNFAHGEFLMLAMYLSYYAVTSLHMNPYLALIVVAPGLYLFGLVVEMTIIKPTIGRSDVVQVFATVGLSIVLQAVALMAFSANVMGINLPITNALISLGWLTIGVPQLIAFVAAMLVAGALFLFLAATDVGRAIRATAQDRGAAALMGVDVPAIYRLTFALGSAMTGLAGGLLMPIYSVSPTVGEQFVLVAFVVVVLGGMGSVTGALVGGLLIGVVETFSGFVIDPQWKQAIYFLIFLIVLVVRPAGLFGVRGSEELSS
ncbi:MAG TPA: branched-chain amino acid ABC transporter permease [Candidatus Dormibacteraeota bacterium]|nr:branched-chain amino acid ABC transporter permease [Candidatus Dormibacteraeota bacterium]